MANEPSGLPLDFSRPMPERNRGRRGSARYDGTIQAFVASGSDHAAVGGDSKAQTRYVALRKSVVRLGVADRIGVSLIAGEVWLYTK